MSEIGGYQPATSDREFHAAVMESGASPEEETAGDWPRVEQGEMKLPQRAAEIMMSAMNKLPVHNALVELKAKDIDSFEHTLRVTQNAVALSWMNREVDQLTDDDIKTMAVVGLMHDSGKCQTPDEILKKKDRLTPVESTVMSFHVANSVEAYENVEDNPMGRLLVMTHHQLQDNKSMPPELVELEVEKAGFSPEQQQKFNVMHGILETADKFDALAFKREYRDGDSYEVVQNRMYDMFENNDGPLQFTYQLVTLYEEGGPLSPEKRFRKPPAVLPRDEVPAQS